MYRQEWGPTQWNVVNQPPENPVLPRRSADDVGAWEVDVVAFGPSLDDGACHDDRGGDGMRAIAVVGWLGIVGALLVWQGIGLVRGPEWPTLSDFFRSFMTVPLGRFLLFALWLWLGWHLFIRGWSFFLRS
jgi:hypothetical protein